MKINLNNTEKIEKALKAANKHCSTRTVDIETLQAIVKKAKKAFFDMDLPKKYQKKAVVSYQEQIRCNSYSDRATSTRVEIMLNGDNQFLTYCDRDVIYARRNAPNDTQLRISKPAVEYLKSQIKTTIDL